MPSAPASERPTSGVWRSRTRRPRATGVRGRAPLADVVTSRGSGRAARMKGIVGLAARQSTAQPVGRHRFPQPVAGSRPTAGPPSTESDISIVKCWNNAGALPRIVCVIAVVAAIAAPAIADEPLASGLTVALLVPAALIDVQTRRLPDVWVGGAAVVPRRRRAGQGDRHLRRSSRPHRARRADHERAVADHASGRAGVDGIRRREAGRRARRRDRRDRLEPALPTLALAAGATATVGVVGRAKSIPFGPGLVGATLVALLAHDVFLRT